MYEASRRVLLTLVCMTTLAGGTAVAQVDIEARNKAAIEDRFAAWSAGTGSPFDLLADEATWTIAGHSIVAKTYANRDAFMRDVIGPFNARMSEGLKPTIRQVVADDDTVVVHFDARAVAHDGKPYTNTYAWFLELREGKIVNATAFFDSISFNDLWRRVQPKQ